MKNAIQSDERFLAEALKLARKGLGHTQTNPLVGAVLVNATGSRSRVIGRGYHRAYGSPHAEVEAIGDAKRNGYDDLSGCILYVNLEPCCHHGKTPPCTDLIIREKIARVVCGTKDPFPLVAGKGFSKLRSAGIQVASGLLEDDCRRLNRFFFKQVETGTPWVGVKVAQSLDGRMATVTGHSKWISGASSRTLVHRLRCEYDAVLVGAGTVIADNPSLNVRLVKGRNPWRIVVDGHLRVPLKAAIFQGEPKKTIVVTSILSSEQKKFRLRNSGVHVLEFRESRDGRIRMGPVFRHLLADLQIGSVLVEGGASIVGQLLEQRLVDEVYMFVAPFVLGDGLSPIPRVTRTIKGALHFAEFAWKPVGVDMLFHGIVK